MLISLAGKYKWTDFSVAEVQILQNFYMDRNLSAIVNFFLAKFTRYLKNQKHISLVYLASKDITNKAQTENIDFTRSTGKTN